jgi:hypothetical protein
MSVARAEEDEVENEDEGAVEDDEPETVEQVKQNCDRFKLDFGDEKNVFRSC